MINIVICDDDMEVCAKIKKAIEQNLELKYKLHIFNGYDLNFHEYILYNNIPSVYILDIELKDENIDGYGIAKKIRRLKAYNDEIIFLSSYTSGIINTYKYKIKPVDFIEKTPYCMLDVVSAIKEAKSRLEERLHEEDNGALIISEGKEVFRLKYKDIVYIEKIKNAKKIQIKIINSSQNYEKDIFYTYKSIEKIYEELDPRFNQISRGIIINKSFVKQISSSGYIMLSTGETFATNARKIKELKDEL